jgi:hypothetical protein
MDRGCCVPDLRPEDCLVLACRGFSLNRKWVIDYDCDWFRVNEAGLITEVRAYVTQNLEAAYGFSSAIRAFMASQH